MISEAFNIDCMEFLKKCKDKEFDLAIVDPPYGDAKNKNQFKRADKKRFGGWFDKYKEVERTGGTWAAKYKKKNNPLGCCTAERIFY